MNSVIAAIDLKAFYSFVECLDRKLDPFITPLVVCDEARGPGTIVLSVTPFLKGLGVPSRLRKRDLPKRDDIIFAVPRMARYIEMSAKVVSIFLDFIGEDDLHVYSIDESFLNLGPYLKLYKSTPRQLVRKILDQIKKETGLFATAGISENLFLAKCALEFEGKKAKDGIGEWTKDDIQTKLWPISPLSEMWGISGHLEKRLNEIGIETIGELANAPEALLIKYFGVIGKDLREHANGIDNSDIREKYIPKETSLSNGQSLFRDYKKSEMPTIIREMSDDLALRLRLEGKKTGLVALMIGYSYEYGGGFSRQMTLVKSTSENDLIYDGLLSLFRKFCEDKPIRRVDISFGKLNFDDCEQLDLFVDPGKQINKRELRKAIDEIILRFGKDAVLRGSALLEESNVIKRHAQIGGHRK
ncbi:MAG TPA: damage repair protein [Bacilli bacterium]|jgi:DNA polymerase V|nr:damage repair protein [Bacilli bacterium]HPV69789.1 damage repair protein [Bacilli bacterium]